jgi:hypothetical protein
MAGATPYGAEQQDMVAVDHARTGHALTGYGLVRPGRLRWPGPRLPRMALGWQDVRQRMHPVKIRWGWVLLLAVVLVLTMGEWGPAVCAIAALP